jgi:PAS domain S-box-containing protein
MKKILPIISIAAAIVILLIGILVIIGWFTHNDFLKILVPGVSFNWALSIFIISGLILLMTIFFSVRKNTNIRKKAAQLIRESEEQIQIIFDAAPDAVIVINESGRIVKWNPKAETIFGWTEKEVTGKLLSETIIPDRFREVHTKGLKNFLRTGEGPLLGKVIETCAVTKNNTELDVALHIAATPKIKGHHLFIGFVRDITEQKKAEKKFEGLLEAAPDAMIIANAKGEIVLINKQTEMVFGYRREELIGKPVEILIPSDFHKRHKGHRDKYFNDPKVRSMGAGLELFAIRKDGTQFPVEISLSPLETEEGILVSASVRDISARKVLEDELKNKNAEMEAFTYSVSHDLRGPLRGIIGFTSILEEEYISKLDDEARRLTSIIKSNTLKMGHLVDDLLAFSKMSKLGLVKDRINTREMIDGIINELTQQNKELKINWMINELASAKADESMIRQVWVNLISNAIKYSSTREQPCIEIGSQEEDRYTVFYVKDNGVGFDEQYKHKLFKVFQRLHDNDEFEGTGVGLAVVEKIVSRHGGGVWAEGKEDEGACFYFSLPNELTQ